MLFREIISDGHNWEISKVTAGSRFYINGLQTAKKLGIKLPSDSIVYSFKFNHSFAFPNTSFSFPSFTLQYMTIRGLACIQDDVLIIIKLCGPRTWGHTFARLWLYSTARWATVSYSSLKTAALTTVDCAGRTCCIWLGQECWYSLLTIQVRCEWAGSQAQSA